MPTFVVVLIAIGAPIYIAGMAFMAYVLTRNSYIDDTERNAAIVIWPIAFPIYLAGRIARRHRQRDYERSVALQRPKCRCNDGDDPCPLPPKEGPHR